MLENDFNEIYKKYKYFHYDEEMLQIWRFRYMCNRGTIVYYFLSLFIYGDKPKLKLIDTHHTRKIRILLCGDYYKRMKHIFGGWFLFGKPYVSL